jgi:hypothetical protein
MGGLQVRPASIRTAHCLATTGAFTHYQHVILDFWINLHYKEIKWPGSYWPPTPEPPNEAAWDKSVSGARI